MYMRNPCRRLHPSFVYTRLYKLVPSPRSAFGGGRPAFWGLVDDGVMGAACFLVVRGQRGEQYMTPGEALLEPCVFGLLSHLAVCSCCLWKTWFCPFVYIMLLSPECQGWGYDVVVGSLLCVFSLFSACCVRGTCGTLYGVEITRRDISAKFIARCLLCQTVLGTVIRGSVLTSFPVQNHLCT